MAKDFTPSYVESLAKEMSFKHTRAFEKRKKKEEISRMMMKKRVFIELS